MISVSTQNQWNEERKTILWKIFVAKSEEYEQRVIRPIRKIFQDELNDVLEKLNAEGRKIESRYYGWSRSKTQMAIKKDRTIEKINIDRKKEEKRIRETITPIIRGVMKEHGEERLSDLLESLKTQFFFNINDPKVAKWIGDRMRRFSKEVTGFTFESIARIVRQGFAEGEPIYIIAQTLRDKFQLWDKYRAPLIARTETISAMNRADLFAVIQSRLDKELKKHWLSSRDAATRETHLDADTRYKDGIAITELFQVGKDKMLHPGGGDIAEENINCRCTMYYSTIEKETAEPSPPTQQVPPSRESDFIFITPKDETELRARFGKLNIKNIAWEGFTAEDAKIVLTNILKELERITYEFPELKNRVEAIPASRHISVLKIYNTETIKIPRKKNRVLGYFHTLETSIHIAAKNIHIGPHLTPGGYVVGDDPISILRHEFGHYLYYKSGIRESWSPNFLQLNSRIRQKISKYAASQRIEFFPETFAYYTSPLYGTTEGLTMDEIFAKLMEKEIGKRRGTKWVQSLQNQIAGIENANIFADCNCSTLMIHGH